MRQLSLSEADPHRRSSNPASARDSPANTSFMFRMRNMVPTFQSAYRDRSDLAPEISLRVADQYVARPPERSNAAPVEKEHSSEASHVIIAAASSGCPGRPIGTRETQ